MGKVKGIYGFKVEMNNCIQVIYYPILVFTNITIHIYIHSVQFSETT